MLQEGKSLGCFAPTVSLVGWLGAGLYQEPCQHLWKYVVSKAGPVRFTLSACASKKANEKFSLHAIAFLVLANAALRFYAEESLGPGRNFRY